MKLNNNTKKLFPYLEILENYRGTVGSYYKSLSEKIDKNNDSLNYLFTQSLTRQIESRYNDIEASKIVAQLEEKPFISTAEHLAIISNPEHLNVLLDLINLAYLHGNKYIVSFPCSTIKLKNELQSRILYFNDYNVTLFKNKLKQLPCLEAPAIHSQLLEEYLSILDTAPVIDKKFEYQCSYLNNEISKKITQNDIKYVFIPQEVLLSDIIVHLDDKECDSLIYRILHHNDTRDAIRKALNGVRSFWDAHNKKGTEFFWHITPDKKLRSLFIQGDYFHSPDGYKFPISDVKEQLLSKKIIPSGGLCLLYFIFDLKLLPFGGIFQVSYLREAIEKLKRNLSTGPWFHQINIDLVNQAYLHFTTSEMSKLGLSVLDMKFEKEDFINHWQNTMHEDAISGCFNFLNKLGEG